MNQTSVQLSTSAIKQLKSLQSQLVQSQLDTLSTSISQLEQLPEVEIFSYLLKALNNERYADAQTIIKDLLVQQQGIAAYIDPVIGALKVELLYQQEELTKAEIERNEISKTINLFHSRYFGSVGHLMEKVLYLRRDKLKIQAETDPRLQEQLSAAEKELEDFYSFQEESKDGVIYQLSDQKLREIKRIYRKGSLKCHPDRVKENERERAEEVFNKLTLAYQRNDLRKVRSIVDFLEKSQGFNLRLDDYQDVDALRAQIENVLSEIEEVQDDAETLRSSNAYYLIHNIVGDWEDYFTNIAENFTRQIAVLENWLAERKA